jgi:hypothetical protein
MKRLRKQRRQQRKKEADAGVRNHTMHGDL